MKTIGLLGGMSWESSAIYYRRINEGVRDRLGGLHSAEIVMRSFDFERIVALQKADRWDEAGMLLGDAAAAMKAAGADCGLICTNTMHLVAEQVESAGGLPLIDIVEATGKAIKEAGFQRPLLLATRYTMEHGFYAERMREICGLEVMVPEASDRVVVHDIIFKELCQGIVKKNSRKRMLQVVDRGLAAGADCIILGCTEICLILDQEMIQLPVFDSTTIHADAAVDYAIGAIEENFEQEDLEAA
jgi:aspartate racemase